MKCLRQKGFGLLEQILIVAITILIAGVMLSLVRFLSTQDVIYRQKTILTQAQVALYNYLNKYGKDIALTSNVSGFSNALSPTRQELIQAGFLPSISPVVTRFNGTLVFKVRQGIRNDMTGFVCDTGTVQERGVPSMVLAAKIASAIPGGVFTTSEAPSTLNGQGYSNVSSPISGNSIVCAIAYVPSPL